MMHNAEINDIITKLYEKVATYAAEDCWYFDLPLALRLGKPLYCDVNGSSMLESLQESQNSVQQLAKQN
jgi:hypothetical protein